MESKHIQLSSLIKSVHEDLRKASRNNENSDEVWEKHKSDEIIRKSYAHAMHELATTIWEENNAVTRINWISQFCKEYFEEGKMEIIIEKETKRFKRKGVSITRCPIEDGKLKLLDVGSCYNPFSKYQTQFDVTAVDLSPATTDVLQCDFLELKISDKAVLSNTTSPVKCLPPNSFNIIVFSLLLEYFPTPKQRYQCCKHASELLKPHGLLFIITPDSKHQNHNSKMMKSWKSLMLHLDLVRVKYEKLTHLHCMAFRKVVPEVIHVLHPVEAISEDELSALLYIPQDTTEYKEEAPVETRTEEEDDDLRNAFSELPFV